MERLQISENGRYFMREDGSPFPWLADTAWTLPQRLKWDDVEYYMKKRKSQGFTVLQIVALDPERDVNMRNPAGVAALKENKLEHPSEEYFAWLDWVLGRAKAYGFYVLLLPVWGQLVTGDNWRGDSFQRIVTEENARTYGRWIGERYRREPHLLWCLGGDRHPIHRRRDYREIWRAMAEGLGEGLTGRKLSAREPDSGWEEVLLTYHTCYEMETGECSTLSYWDAGEAWIRFVMLQSGHTRTPRNYELVEKEYGRIPVRPVWDGEPAYEEMPAAWPVLDSFHDAWMVRTRAYFSLLAGAFGFTYGHASVWSMTGEKERSRMCRYTWYEALQSEGSGQMKILRGLMDGLGLPACRPAQERLLRRETKEEIRFHIQAAVGEKDDFFCAYLPQGGELWFDVSGLGWERIWLWWYSPRDGEFYSEKGDLVWEPHSGGAASEPAQAQAPTKGPGQDWIFLAMKERTERPVKEKVYFSFEEEARSEKIFQWN